MTTDLGKVVAFYESGAEDGRLASGVGRLELAAGRLSPGPLDLRPARLAGGSRRPRTRRPPGSARTCPDRHRRVRPDGLVGAVEVAGRLPFGGRCGPRRDRCAVRGRRASAGPLRGALDGRSWGSATPCRNCGRSSLTRISPATRRAGSCPAYPSDDHRSRVRLPRRDRGGTGRSRRRLAAVRARAENHRRSATSAELTYDILR